jgi:hypothetical protein
MDETRGREPEGLIGEVDPAGLPRPASDEWFGVVMKAMVVFGLAGTGLFAIAAATSHHTMGATRSTRLTWERRRRIMAEEVRRCEAGPEADEDRKGDADAAATE